MTENLKVYLKTEAIVSGAFNFFINGMFAGIIHHMKEMVATDTASIVIDICLTCISTSLLSIFFNKASIKRSDLEGIIESNSRIMKTASKLYRSPILFALLIGSLIATIIGFVTVLLFILCGIISIGFYMYLILKCVFSGVLGAGITLLQLRAGMTKVSNED